MSITVIFLLIIGICLIVASFIFFDKEDAKKQVVKLNDYELDEQELIKLQESIKNVVKEYSEQLIEDTNQQLTSMSNQKMMGISELADQVLEDIKKNHQECVFLYDMLEDKGEQLKAYVSNSAEKLFAIQEEVMKDLPEGTKEEVFRAFEQETKENQVQDYLLEHIKQADEVTALEEDMEGTAEVQERNQQILSMYKKGMEPIAIAKDLDLGVGEVQLVVDLFQGDR